GAGSGRAVTRGAAAPSAGAPAGVHGALGIRGADVVAADAQWQAGPEGTAGTGGGTAGSGGLICGAADTDRGAAGGHLGRGDGARWGGGGGGFLRAGRPLAAGDAGRLAGARGLRRLRAAAGAVRGAYRGRSRRP